ncbi:MAG: prepilin-type N-terminal cleavage/methylation domain-containing protein [Gallionella sp.]|nr:prepilin-type N-terminal cleavage/methylation domain-containing protein [Gallionella sp.]
MSVRRFISRGCAQQGFTLIEIAVVLAILGLLLGGLVPTISSQMEHRQTGETQRQLAEIQQALVGFAIAHGRFPCPASLASNGDESPKGGGNCTNFYNGYVPAAVLGITSVDSRGLVTDAWGNPIRYAVTAWSSSTVSNVYTTSNGIAHTGLSALNPNLLVCGTSTGLTASGCASGSALTSAPGVPVVVYSTGKNGGYGGVGADEAANPNPNSANNDRVFVSHTPTSASSANGEFDDIVVWISNHVLLNRMVSAGKLP